jgi:endonuclease/exonuclease/phosphatase family metal-dependent hydrolase
MAGAAAYAISACGGTDNNFAPIETRPDADNGPVDVLQTQPLRLATFNTNDLFNDKADSDLGAAETIVTADVYKAHLSGVAKILAKLNADVVVLQEVENESVLTDLAAQPELADRKYDFHAAGASDKRGLRIAALSSIPFQKVLSHATEMYRADGSLITGNNGETGLKFPHDCLELHVSLGRTIVLLGSHLSAPSEDTDENRLAASLRTRGIAAEYIGVSGVVVVGDFEDVPGSVPINSIVGDAPKLASAVTTLPSASQFTYVDGNTKKLLDDQYADPAMAGFRDPASITVLQDSDLDASLASVSDHSPVAVTYNIQ